MGHRVSQGLLQLGIRPNPDVGCRIGTHGLQQEPFGETLSHQIVLGPRRYQRLIHVALQSRAFTDTVLWAMPRRTCGTLEMQETTTKCSGANALLIPTEQSRGDPASH